jgi:hypothetical protein
MLFDAEHAMHSRLNFLRGALGLVLKLRKALEIGKTVEFT